MIPSQESLIRIFLNVILTSWHCPWQTVRSRCYGSSDRSPMLDPLIYFSSSQCSIISVSNKVICASLSLAYIIKEPLLLIVPISPCSGDSWFPILLSEWSFTICLTTYNLKYNVLCGSLNKTFPSFLRCCIAVLTPCLPSRA